MERGHRADVPPSAHFTEVAPGVLGVDGHALAILANVHGTPLHVVSAAAIRRAYASVAHAIGPRALVAYAMKANGNPAILRLLASLGAGADVVSGGELYWALKAGIPADRIVMSGVGKRDDEIGAAIDAGIRAIHVESEPELDVVAEIARSRGVRARIGLRINPDVDPKTHPYIATGLHDTKFGLEIDVARRLLTRVVSEPFLELTTIASHIGSMIPEAASIAESVAISGAFAREAIAAGANVRAIDAGGGWPIAYGDEDQRADTHAAFGAAIREGMMRGGVPRSGSRGRAGQGARRRRGRAADARAST